MAFTKVLAITLFFALAYAQDSELEYDVNPSRELDGVAEMGVKAPAPKESYKALELDSNFEEELLKELPYIKSTYNRKMLKELYKYLAGKRAGKTNYEASEGEGDHKRVRRAAIQDDYGYGQGHGGHGGYGGHHGGNHHGHGGHYSTAKWHGGEKWNGGNFDQGHGKHGYHGHYGDQNHGHHHGNYKKGLQDHYKTNGERVKTYSYGGHGWYKEMSHGHQHGQGGQAAQHGGQHGQKHHGQFYRQWQPYWKDQGKTGGHQEHYGYH